MRNDILLVLIVFGTAVFLPLYAQFGIEDSRIPGNAELEFVPTPEVYRADDQIPVKIAYKNRQEGMTYRNYIDQPVLKNVKFVLSNTKACSLDRNPGDKSQDGTHTVYISCTKNLKEPVELFAHYRNKVISVSYVPQGDGLLAQAK